MSRTVSQTINLQAVPEAVSKYITRIDGGGISIHDTQRQNLDYLQLTSNGIDIKQNNISIASFGANGARIGQLNGAHSVIDSNGQRFYATNGTTQLANIGYGKGQSESGTAIAPFYTFGVRDTDTSVVGNYSFAEGKDIAATGYASHAEGVATGATAQGAHAEGDGSGALGRASHAEGYGTQASGNYSHSQNNRTIAQRQSQTALGEFNIADTSGSVSTRGKYSIIIGNGTSVAARSNALTVDWQGRIECGDYSGTLTSIFDIFYPVGSYYDTSDSSFDPNTSLGGTWTSEQIKDDEIVEQGTNSIWTYRKWKSGIAECWGRRDITISLTNNYGGAYYNTDAVGFPTGLFNAEPTVSISRQGRQGTGLVHISPYSVSSTQIQYFITNTNSRYDSAQIGIAINARGLWKTYSAPTTKYRWHRTA